MIFQLMLQLTSLCAKYYGYYAQSMQIITACYFIEKVKTLGLPPTLLKIDCGNENELMATLQWTISQDFNAHK